MTFLLREHFKKELSEIFGLKEADADPQGGDMDPNELEAAITNDVADDTTPEDQGTDEPKEQPADDKGGADDNIAASDNEANASTEPPSPEKEEVPGTGDDVQTGNMAETGKSKIQTMFADTGSPSTDYSLTNPNNIRFAKFRFENAGIDINQMMNDVEKKAGITSDKLIFRLTPDQYDSYKDKGKAVRRAYDLVEKREKNVIFYNSKIPIYTIDKNTNKMKKIDDNDPNLLKNAFSKIDEFMVKRFGENWVDDMNAIDFIQSIKVNFAEKDSVTPNMLTVQYFESNEDKLIPFNKLYVKTPKTVEDFVRDNKDNQDYLRSSVYRTLAAGFLDGSTDSNGVFATIKGDEVAEQSPEEAGGEDENEKIGAEGESKEPAPENVDVNAEETAPESV